MIGYDDFTQDDLFAIDKAIIACEQLRKARKKAKRWKRKYLNLEANYDEDVREAVEYNNKMWKAVQKGEQNERPTNRKSNGWY